MQRRRSEEWHKLTSILSVLIVVGHSYSGFVAFWMAHNYPNVVRRLVIISSAICMMSSTNDTLLKELGFSDIKDVLLPINSGDLRKSMSITFYKKPWLPNCIYEDFIQTMGRNRKQRAELLDAIVIGSKNSQSLPIMKQDVLIVWGEKDRTFTLEQANLLQRHIGEKAKLVVIKECGHVPQLKKPAELNETLLQFLLLDG